MADTVYFKHQCIMMPTYTNTDTIVAASNELILVLQNDTSSNKGQTGKEKLSALIRIFNKVATTIKNKEENQSSSSPSPTSIHPRVETMQKANTSTGKQTQITSQTQLQTKIYKQQQIEVPNGQLIMGQQSITKHIVMCLKSPQKPHVISQEEELPPTREHQTCRQYPSQNSHMVHHAGMCFDPK